MVGIRGIQVLPAQKGDTCVAQKSGILLCRMVSDGHSQALLHELLGPAPFPQLMQPKITTFGSRSAALPDPTTNFEVWKSPSPALDPTASVIPPDVHWEEPQEDAWTVCSQSTISSAGSQRRQKAQERDTLLCWVQEQCRVVAGTHRPVCELVEAFSVATDTNTTGHAVGRFLRELARTNTRFAGVRVERKEKCGHKQQYCNLSWD